MVIVNDVRNVQNVIALPLFGAVLQPDLARISSTCNVYQEADPMVDSWEALHKTVKYFGDSGHGMVNFSHAGSWNLANPASIVTQGGRGGRGGGGFRFWNWGTG